MLQIGDIADKTTQVPSDSSSGDSTSVPKDLYFLFHAKRAALTCIRLAFHRPSKPSSYGTAADSRLDGEAEKAVLPGSARRDTHSAAAHPLRAAAKRRAHAGGRDAGRGGGDPSPPVGHQLRRCGLCLTVGAALGELLRAAPTGAHLSLPSAHAACTGAPRLVNPLLAVGQEAAALFS